MTTVELILRWMATMLLPVALSALFYLLDRKSAFGRCKEILKQLVYGLVFGLIGSQCALFSVPLGDAILATQSAFILCAGLLLGAPAGVISGLICGAFNYAAPAWVGGVDSRLADLLSASLMGIGSALLRKYMFDNKKPLALYALLIGFMSEVMHMMLVFVSNLTNLQQAFVQVENSALPTMVGNSLSLMLAILVLKFLSGDVRQKRAQKKNITTEFQRWLLVCVVVAFAATVGFTMLMQQQIFRTDTEELLALNLSDVVEDISDASDSNLLDLTRQVAERVDWGIDIAQIKENLNIAEINIVNEDGLICETTTPMFLMYNMRSGPQSFEFIGLLEGETEYVQSYQPTSFAKDVSMKYAGVVLEQGGFVQVGYDAQQFQRDIAKEVVMAAKNRHVGQTGSMIIADENWAIVSDSSGSEGENLYATGLWIDTAVQQENVCYGAEIYGEPCYYMYCVSEGYYIISLLPQAEAQFNRNLSIYLTVFTEVIVFAVLFILVYFLIKRLVVNNVRRINESLSQITGGNLDVVVDVRSNEEFASLSDDINSTVLTLKHYIAEAAARIDEELHFAKNIQHAALPSIFPPFPERKDFDIFASMDTAKEVGGDFYDFFLVDGDKLAFLIADVSGKGIPAALFMMSAKSLIKGYVESGQSANEAFTHANNKLCEGNEAGMFVTAWLGILDLRTGVLEYANAGHNPPLLMRAGGEFVYLRSRPGLVLAGMEGICYRKNALQLARGDRMYLYTDGVTEATDTREELFGEDRLCQSLNACRDSGPQVLCRTVKADVDAFVGEAPQFDDITMLCLDYIGPPARELVVPPEQEQMPVVAEFVEEAFAAQGVPAKAAMKLNIAVDEIFSNIAKFSGASFARIICFANSRAATLIFEDDGEPYDPLKKADPDTTLSADERAIGGLGIFMVKKSMTEMSYAYTEGKNILRLKLEYA